MSYARLFLCLGLEVAAAAWQELRTRATRRSAVVRLRSQAQVTISRVETALRRRMKTLPLIWAGLAGVIWLSAQRAESVTIEAGSIVTLAETLEDLSFASGSNLYIPPNAGQQLQFRTLAGSLLAGNVVAADAQAAALNYELVQFTDIPSGQIYLGVREILNMGQQTLGWGSYFVNLSFGSNVLVEAPHPRFDTNSPEIAVRVFRQSEAADTCKPVLTATPTAWARPTWPT